VDTGTRLRIGGEGEAGDRGAPRGDLYCAIRVREHSLFQREGNRNVQFRHIVEYPFFTDSKLSNGVQLADLCAYNVHRAFRSQDFAYPYFQRLLPAFYCSRRTAPDKLDGLKVFPDESQLVEFAAAGCRDWLQSRENERPAPGSGPKN
jgi:hypothetical protein